MADIADKNTPWEGHSGLEVETFIKNMFDTKVGYIDFNNMKMTFYDEQGGTALGSFTIGGDIFRINLGASLSTVFYVLADETSKVMTLSPSTTKTPLGSQDAVDYIEDYTYIVAVDTGSGYVPRFSGNIGNGESVSFDLRNYLVIGNNKIRVSITGTVSDQTNTTVFTGIVSTLTMSCNHDWQNIWRQNSSYVLNGIRFAGNLEKYLHVSVTKGGVTTELPSVKYNANQSYVSTSTTYTIPASAFPFSDLNGICTVNVWMTAQGISTPVVSFNIMCVTEEDGTPMVVINGVSSRVFNFTSGKLFSYAVYNADTVVFNLEATLGGSTYGVALDKEYSGRDDGYRYDFVYDVAVDTGVSDILEGVLEISAVPYYHDDVGLESAVDTVFDNTYSYVATPGYLFYMNAATRDNASLDYDKIVNDVGAGTQFDSLYDADWYGFSWNTDGWVEDEYGNRALFVPAGSHVSVPDFTPFYSYTAFQDGMTLEMLIKAGHPSDYNTPILTICTSSNPSDGLIVYPTKVVMFGSYVHNETVQSVELSENQMTHIVVTMIKRYGGESGRNLCSVYVNGISNVNFDIGSSTFGNGSLYIGQSDTDVYLYKMRVYGTALDARSVLNNYLNCMVSSMGLSRESISEDNGILDGNVVSYDLVKAAGLDTMVVTIPNDAEIPSFVNQVKYSGCTLSFEYAGHPEKNVIVDNVGLEGQGTTSMQYFRWNLRSKTSDATTWTYGSEEPVTGKTGRMINDTNYRILDRITAKKNYASSMQGHKMGMTGLYNDLYKQLGLGSHLPDSDYRVTVYQFPFMGFRTLNEDQKEFIGLYTVGPDKGSKKTFGYSAAYQYLLSLEGPDHDLRGTRFLHPWVDEDYDTSSEALTFGGERAWECSYVGNDLTTDDDDDKSAIKALFESEWAPAYEVVFNNSPYLVSASEMCAGLSGISTVSDLCSASNVEAIFAGRTNGHHNGILSFYDDEYELYFYSNKESKFVKLSTVDSTREHNVVSALYSGGYLDTQSPTTAQIVAARRARFYATAGNYWDIDQTLYHYCFCILFGVTDNFAKNSYPFKFRGYSETLVDGESTYCKRWGWRQDDLDTVLATDNNGRSTKPYYVEHGDVNSLGNDIFQGGSSALWVLVRDCFRDEIVDMMADIVDAASSITRTLGIQGRYEHESLFNLVSHYCWEKSAKYFPQIAYEKDKEWAYVEPWLIDSAAQYNNVAPLDQALGDQLQAEKLWVERRIAYIFSKYRIGAFTKDNAGYSRLAITLANPFTFQIVPAIDLYPVASVGESGDYPDYGGQSAKAGYSFNLWCPAGGNTTNYIHGVDWLASLGDLSGMQLDDRGGGDSIVFSISGERLQELKIGDSDASKLVNGFNARALQVSSPSLKVIDARNTSTISNEVDLLNCPRLTTCLFNGSGAVGLKLPVGARLTNVSFPESAESVFMHSLPLLDEEHLSLPTLSNIKQLYINNCANINPFDLIEEIVDEQDESLEYVTLIWRGTKTITQEQSSVLVALADKQGYVSFENGNITVEAGVPYIEGTVAPKTMISANNKVALENTYEALVMGGSDSNYYIDFEDSNVESVCLAHWDTNSDRKITLNEAKAVTSIVNYFYQNTSIVNFDEFKYFTGMVTLQPGNADNQAFANCTNLKKITIPNSVRTIGRSAFRGCSNLESINLDNVTSVGNTAFMYCYKLNVTSTPGVTSIGMQGFRETAITDVNMPSLTAIGSDTFYGCSKLVTVTNLGSITSIPNASSGGYGVFRNCSNLVSVVLPSGLTTIGNQAFNGLTKLETINLPESITTINTNAFYGCTKMGIVVNLPNLTSIANNAFYNSGITAVTSLGSITSLPSGNYRTDGVFNNCTKLVSVVLPNTITSITGGTFLNCTALTTINLENITDIAARGFYNTKLQTVTLPSIVTLGTTTDNTSGCFGACASLTSVDIGENCTSIGRYAFRNCYALATFIIRATTPPALAATDAFGGVPSTLKIYVPDASIDTYKAEANWSSYVNNFHPLSELPE